MPLRTIVVNWRGTLTGISVAGEVAAPLHERSARMRSARDLEAANSADGRSEAERGLRSDDAVGDVMVESLAARQNQLDNPNAGARGFSVLTLCSSCLISCTVPSLKVHLTMSVSGLVPLASSELLSVDRKRSKLPSLIRCQTWERCAGISADSCTEVLVGMDMVAVGLIDESCLFIHRLTERDVVVKDKIP